MKRRDFVQYTTVTGSAVLLDPGILMKKNQNHVGVQIWSVRDAADKDPKGTFELLRKMGYEEIEGYKYDSGKFYSYTPAEYKKLLTDIGLKMPSAHTGVSLKHWDVATHTINDLARKTIDDHAAIGIQQLLCPHIDEALRKPEILKQLCELFNHMGEACKKAGIQFGYHNHAFEFKKENEIYVMDTILQNTDSSLVAWEMDLYWVKYANEDPATWINKYGKRIHAFHVKDMANTTKRETIEVGEGTIDFESIFKLKKACNVSYYIVELEDYRTTSMQGVDFSLQNLKKILSRV